MKTHDKCLLTDIVEFNPAEILKKGVIAKKISMDCIAPFTRAVQKFSTEPYSGGAKFRNGDTLMARITPCLENGKTAYVNILPKNEVAFGSTEYIVCRAIPDKSLPLYVYYLTISKIVRKTAIKSMVGSSGRQRVQQEALNSLEIPNISLPEQQHIVNTMYILVFTV